MTEVATWRIKYFSWYNSTWNVSDLLQCNLETILIIMAYFIALRALSSSQPKQLPTERHYDKYFIKVSFRSSVPKCKNIRFSISQDREKQERFNIHTCIHYILMQILKKTYARNIFTRSPFRQ